jgi:RND superfamily putative drug exporter
MVFAFLCFVALSMTSMKEIGLGLAIAVLLDATVVRALLLPAVMQLLGEANWYLRRLPALRHEAAPAASGSIAVPRPRSTAEEPLVLSND